MLQVGDKVKKTAGEYLFPGVVVAVFTKLNNKSVRVVVENPDGILHIFSESHLVKE